MLLLHRFSWYHQNNQIGLSCFPTKEWDTGLLKICFQLPFTRFVAKLKSYRRPGMDMAFLERFLCPMRNKQKLIKNIKMWAVRLGIDWLFMWYTVIGWWGDLRINNRQMNYGMYELCRQWILRDLFRESDGS